MAGKGILLKRCEGEAPRVVPATAQLVRESTLANDRAFQTPVLFDFSRGRSDVTISELRAGGD
jgi:hypothetical protein